MDLTCVFFNLVDVFIWRQLSMSNFSLSTEQTSKLTMSESTSLDIHTEHQLGFSCLGHDRVSLCYCHLYELFSGSWFFCFILMQKLERGEIFNMISVLQVDAAVLQYQNQKLVQKLDAQKHQLHDLEVKIKELKDKQTSYDDMLITVNQLWNQVKCCFFFDVYSFSCLFFS